MIDNKPGKITITGGFFWAEEGQACIRAEGGGHWLEVNGCRFWARPKRWWHFRAWYRAWRAWLGLPDRRNQWLP